ncbi:MAG: alanine racemase [Chlorobi bacterium]|nr:alanine racemase [Chlorobiota bacterium]
MAKKASNNNVIFRPHFKTHQSELIGTWFRNAGITKITVSSLEMAEYFATHYWDDITIAIPLNIRELDKVVSLTKKIQLNIILDSLETANSIRNINSSLNYFIEIDTGYKRTGVNFNDKNKIDKILSLLHENQHFTFKGFLNHNGSNYCAKSKEEIKKNHAIEIEALMSLKKHYSKYFKNLIISIGDTPACSVLENFSGIDEIRPGNFVFYDWMQYKLGSCSINDIAVTMICPVLGKYADRQEIVIHGGAVHFSKEFIINEEGLKNYGQIAEIVDGKWNMPITDCYLSSLSQEHGIVKCSGDFFNKTNIGDQIVVYPIHSCLTMNLMKNNYRIV